MELSNREKQLIANALALALECEDGELLAACGFNDFNSDEIDALFCRISTNMALIKE